MICRLLILGIAVNACLAIGRDKQYAFNNKNEIKEEEKSQPIPYNFEYNSRDENGTTQFRKETSDANGKVQGRYGYKDQFGIERIVEYTADENGYRAEIKTNEPGTMNKNPASVLYNAQPMVYAAETDYGKKAELQNTQTFSSDDKSQVLSQPQAPGSRQYFFTEEQPQIVTSSASAATSNDEGAKKYTFFGLNDDKKTDSAVTYTFPSSATEEKSSLTTSNEHTSIQYAAPQQFQYASGHHQQNRILVSPLNQYYQYAPQPQHQYATVQHSHIPAQPLAYTNIPHNAQPLAYSHIHQNAQPLAYSNIPQNAQPVLIQYAPQPVAYQTGIPSSAHQVPAYNLVNYQQYSSPSKTQ